MRIHEHLPEMRNGDSAPLEGIPMVGIEDFRGILRASDARLAVLLAIPDEGGRIKMIAVQALESKGRLRVLGTSIGGSYAAFTPDCPAAHLFEREIAEETGVKPEGHPWLKPVRFPFHPVGVTDYFQVQGGEIHEVAVGPVHAGIIEPGHFRFQCHGEEVLSLEISLGYQHRGVEKAAKGGPHKRTLSHMETLAGDTTIGHALSYAQILESLSGCRAPVRAQALRGVALELERLANHAGDLGAMAGDVGYLPTASYCGRIRGDILNLTALFCGNRFGRDCVRPGGVSWDLEPERAKKMGDRLERIMRDLRSAVGLMWASPSVMGRFEGTGVVRMEECEALGMVGVAARACGVPRDVRNQFPMGIYRFAQIPVTTQNAGDVFSRAYVRWLEIQRSASFVLEQLKALPEGLLLGSVGALKPNHLAVSMVEGWRGEICHVALTDGLGRFLLYKVVDPSFHNWAGLAQALRGQAISDFPLCNKSFNLSYCGHDL